MSSILIIDDDLAGGRTLDVHLRSLGHRARHAATFEEGIAAARSHPPDIVILDDRMPGIRGLDGLPRLRHEFPDTPVIVVTAHHDRETVLRAFREGASDCLAKPLDINRLDVALAEACRGCRR